MELSRSKQGRLRFAPDGASITCKQVKSNGPLLSKPKAAKAEVEAEKAAAKSNVEWLSSSELALRGDVELFAQRVDLFKGKVNRMRQDCKGELEDVFSSGIVCGWVLMPRHCSFFGLISFSIAVHRLHEQHCGCSNASHFRFKLFLSSLGFWFCQWQCTTR